MGWQRLDTTEQLMHKDRKPDSLREDSAEGREESRARVQKMPMCGAEQVGGHSRGKGAGRRG